VLNISPTYIIYMINHKRRLPDHYFSCEVNAADIPIFAIGGCPSLGNCGYSLNNNNKMRHQSLQKAINQNGFSNVYKKLYLLKNNDIVAEDLAYLKQLHREKQGGGQTYQFKEIDIKKEKHCLNGKCDSTNTIYELHRIDGKELIFYTLTISDANQVHELDLAYLDSDQTLEQTKEKINANNLIGIKSGDKLQGYCEFAPDSSNNSTVKIIWFCANKSYGTPLYQFMEKYFGINGYEQIVLVVSLEGFYAIRRLNFWNRMGFTTYEIKHEKKQLYMRKFIKS
jgi:hypothetical protein